MSMSQQQIDDKTFLIAGCNRSGTTMMRLIMDCHSQVWCYDEHLSYPFLAHQNLVAAFRWANGNLKFHETRREKDILVGFKIPRFSEQFDYEHPSDHGLDGMRLETTQPFYRGQKTIFMVRDYRDVIASMMKLTYNGVPWVEYWVPSMVAHRIGHDGDFEDKWAADLELVRKNESAVAWGAFYWKYKNESILRYHKKGYPVFSVCYENFVKNPRVYVFDICDFLGIPFEEAMLHHEEKKHSQLLQGGKAIGETDPSRSIDDSSVSNWKRWIPMKDMEIMHSIAAPLWKQLRDSLIV